MNSSNILPISRTPVSYDTIADAEAAFYMEGIKKLWEAQARLDKLEREIAELSKVLATVTEEEQGALRAMSTAA